MERKTRQILTAAAVLVSATVLSLGVRQARVMMHRSRIAAEPVSRDAGPKEYADAEPVASEQNVQAREQVDIPTAEEHQFTDPYTEEPATHSEEAFDEAREEAHTGDEKRRYETKKHWDKSTAFTDKQYSKKIGEYKKGVEYVPMKLSETETLYTGKPGEYWLVQNLPDGGVTKMQMQEIDGELQPVSEAKTYAPKRGEAKSGGDNGK